MIHNVYDIVEDIDIKVGDTKRIDCPTCGGYNTFTISNISGSKVWNCYKASCAIKGKINSKLSAEEIRQSFDNKKQCNIKFELPEYIVPMKESNFCDKFYGIRARDVLYDVKENRVVFLIKKDNEVIDAVGRALGKRLPKWKRYGKSKVPYVAWAKLKQTCVLVEDCISAYTVTKYGVTGVALLGTSLLEEHKQFLSKQFSRVIVALDPDALPKSLQIAKELKNWVIEVKLLKLTDDLKYCKDTDINKLGELVWN